MKNKKTQTNNKKKKIKKSKSMLLLKQRKKEHDRTYRELKISRFLPFVLAFSANFDLHRMMLFLTSHERYKMHEHLLYILNLNQYLHPDFNLVTFKSGFHFSTHSSNPITLQHCRPSLGLAWTRNLSGEVWLTTLTHSPIL